MFKKRHDIALHRSKTKNKKQLPKMPFSSPFSIEDLRCLKPFKNHVTKIEDQKISQMGKHVDIKLLARFHDDWIDHSP